jgi:hypothetical protein
MGQGVSKRKTIAPAGSGGAGINSATQTALNLKQDFPLREAMVDANKVFSAGKTEVYLSVVLTAARTLTLPLANAFAAGTELIFLDEIGGITTTNTVTFTRAGADLINNATTIVFDTTRGTARFITDGTSKWTASYSTTYETGTWTPTYGGFSANPTSISAEYTLIGNLCTDSLYAGAVGTSNSATTTVTLSHTPKSSQFYDCLAVEGVTLSTGRVAVTAGSNIATITKSVIGTAFANSGNKNFDFTITYKIQ